MEAFEQSNIPEDNPNTSLLSKLLVLLGVVALLTIGTGGYLYLQALQESHQAADMQLDAPTGKLYLTLQSNSTNDWRSAVWSPGEVRFLQFEDVSNNKFIEPLHISFLDNGRAIYKLFLDDKGESFFVADIIEEGVLTPKLYNIKNIDSKEYENLQNIQKPRGISPGGKSRVEFLVNEDGFGMIGQFYSISTGKRLNEIFTIIDVKPGSLIINDWRQ